MVMQIAVFIRPHDVVNAERPRAPPERRLVCGAVVGVEQPPAAHVGLGAVGGHDVQVGRALGSADQPGRHGGARQDGGKQPPEEFGHDKSPPWHEAKNWLIGRDQERGGTGEQRMHLQAVTSRPLERQ
ncbi:hypothetical protein D9M71_567340 [compost metagenome]